MLRTCFCELVGIDYPLAQAGMGLVARADLAAAVSAAGGLGMIGGAGMAPEELRAEIRRVREQTGRPFGVDLLLASVPATDGTERYTTQVQEAAAVVVEERVPVFAAGLGNPGPLVPQIHAYGGVVLALVGNVKAARRVAAAGVDVVVAQGHEAGGHTGRIGTLALVPQVVDAVAPTPVAAAGGIADGRGLAAALALGAHGVWCGTVFLATHEANLYDWQKQRIVGATEEDTIVTRLYSGKTMRNITNPLAQAWEASGLKALPMGLQGLLIADLVAGARQSGKDELLMNAAGQAAGMISHLRSAAEVVEEMVAGAVRVLTEDLPAAARAERAVLT